MKNLFLFLFLSNFATSFSQSQPQFHKDSVSIIYKIIDTSALKLDIYYPLDFNKKKIYPAIIFFYGGGWINGSLSQFLNHAKYFSSRGLITILADYRVSSKHKTTPFEAVKDGKSAIRFLRMNSKKFYLNRNKIIAAGGSAGAHIAAAADLTILEEEGENVSISSRPDALVLFNPVFDNGPGGYGYDRIGSRYTEISPLHNIKKGAAPTIVFFGTKDDLVPVKTAKLYKSKMEEVGSRCDLFLYPDQKHGFFNYKGDLKYFKETVQQADIFLESLGYLKGKPTIANFKF
jgi:acetyl esterase/lipase